MLRNTYFGGCIVRVEQLICRTCQTEPGLGVWVSLSCCLRSRLAVDMRYKLVCLAHGSDGTLSLASCGALQFLSWVRTHSREPSQAADNVAKTSFSGELILNLNGHTKGLSDISWSPDSVYLADDHTIQIWDADSVRTILDTICEIDEVWHPKELVVEGSAH